MAPETVTEFDFATAVVAAAAISSHVADVNSLLLLFLADEFVEQVLSPISRQCSSLGLESIFRLVAQDNISVAVHQLFGIFLPAPHII